MLLFTDKLNQQSGIADLTDSSSQEKPGIGYGISQHSAELNAMYSWKAMVTIINK
jgi:hypothetical protein